MLKKTALPVIFILLCIDAVAQNTVGLFDQCNYSGKSYYLTEGSYRAYQMKIDNDKLSSLQIPYGMRVTIYQNDDFKGQSATYTADMACIPEGMNDNASSIVIENLNANQSGYNQNDYVTFYNDCYSKGYSQNLKPGIYPGYKLGSLKLNISSFTIYGNLQVKVYTNSDNTSGYSTTLETSQNCLSSSYNDQIRSLVVEYRSGNTYPGNNNNYPGNNNNNNSGGSVTFYNDCYSQGYSQTLYPGTYYGNQIGILKQNISSLTINGDVQVKVYLNSDNATGYSYLLETSQSCLSSSYNDKIRSFIIEYKPTTGTTTNYPNYGGDGSYATVYTECNYGGNSLRLAPGYYQGDKLGLLKYDISSIEIPSNLRAKVFINNEYLSGTSYNISENTSCLSTTLNNRIGSIVIEEKKGGYNNNNNYPNNNNNNNNYPQYDEKVILYSDGNFKGVSSSVLPGNYSTMAQAGFTDNTLSSLYLPAGYRVVLYEFENFGGKTYTITATKSGFTISGWNDKTSSIAIYKN